MLTHTEVATKEQFFARVSAGSGRRRDIFVFVHGYNVSFEDALRRTGQLVFDLQFEGTAISYTWPSGAGVQDYLVAEGTVDWAKRHLALFLADLTVSAGSQSIHVVAHSLGNRLLARALDQLIAENKTEDPFLDHLVMAAADLDVDEYRQLAPHLKESTGNLTIYVSPNARALKASRTLARYARVGEGGKRMVLLPGVDTIDAGNDEGVVSFLNHSYLGDSRSVLGDLWQLIDCRWSVDERDGLSPSANADPRYWRLISTTKRRTECRQSR
jgi:esterase/lipase superfamily enzyme